MQEERCDVGCHTLSPALATAACLVAPVLGRFMVFPGNLLHGVLPGNTQPCHGLRGYSGAAQAAQLCEPLP